MLTGFLLPVYHRDTSLPGALAAGLMYGGFPLVFAGIAWQHPVPGGAIGIAYSVLSTAMMAAYLGIEFIIQSPILRSPGFYYVVLMTIYLIGSTMVLVSGKTSSSSKDI